MSNGTNNQPERMDQVEATLENITNVVAGLANSVVASNARMDRFEALLETSYEPIQALLEVATQNQAMIERLDAILERISL